MWKEKKTRPFAITPLPNRDYEQIPSAAMVVFLWKPWGFLSVNERRRMVCPPLPYLGWSHGLPSPKSGWVSPHPTAVSAPGVLIWLDGRWEGRPASHSAKCLLLSLLQWSLAMARQGGPVTAKRARWWLLSRSRSYIMRSSVIVRRPCSWRVVWRMPQN